MNHLLAITRRELQSYFSNQLGYVFIFIYLVLAGVFTFYLGNFFERGQADLLPFFSFHPWLYLFLVPPIAMRLWAEEHHSGSIELLMTLPIKSRDLVLGKFLAAWFFTGLALFLTTPMWLTVNFLGDPDNGVILASYLGSWLMAGGFLSIGSCMSALTKSQVIAFLLTGSVCLLFVMAGFPMVLNLFESWVPLVVLDAVASLSFLTHFNSIAKGVVSLQDIAYFVSVIVFWLAVNTVVINQGQGARR